MGKSTISMTIFNRYVSYYQRDQITGMIQKSLGWSHQKRSKKLIFGINILDQQNMTFPSNSERGYHIIWNPVISSCHPFFEWQKWAMKKTSTHETSRKKKPSAPRASPMFRSPWCISAQKCSCKPRPLMRSRSSEMGSWPRLECLCQWNMTYIYIHRFIWWLYDGYNMVIIWLSAAPCLALA